MKLVLAIFISMLLFVESYAQDSTVATRFEFNPRGYLPHFFHRVKKKLPVTVAYFGGSITMADKGWRDQTFEWLRTRYPKTSFKQIMASIGGTGSDFGACRIHEHVLQFNPDLVFVEFSVNDNARSFKEVCESMEGIVRQIRKHNKQTDICFVYTLSKGNIASYQKGQLPVSAAAMEFVAEHYQLPSINVAIPIAKLIRDSLMRLEGSSAYSAGKMVFAKDGVHPFSETGHRLYAESVEKYFLSIEKQEKMLSRKLRAPLEKNNWENAGMFPLPNEKTKLGTAWQVSDSVVRGKPFSKFVSSVYSSADINDSTVVRFRGTFFGFADIMGPSSGQLEIQVDGEKPVYIDRFDGFCTYYRLNYFFIKGLEDKAHVVVIKNAPNRLDKKTILASRNATMSDPALYRQQASYFGYLLVSTKR